MPSPSPQQPEDPTDRAVLAQDKLNSGLGKLPGPNARPARAPSQQELGGPPDHIDANYLEFSTSESGRGLQLLNGVVTLAMLPFLAWQTVELFLYGDDPGLIIFMLVIFFFLLAVGVSTFRGALARPLSEPIRFNRSRQRVYIYRLKRNFNPFSRSGWKASTVDFPWQSLRAIKGRSKYAEHVYFQAIDASGSGISEKFHLSRHNGGEGAAKWMLARLFMQEGIEALPEFNECAPKQVPQQPAGFLSKLVPKTRWPAKTDIASRSAKHQPPESLVSAPTSDAQLQQEFAQMKRFRRIVFTRAALGISGAWIAVTAVLYSPSLWRDATQAWAWLQGAEPLIFESPESLVARAPGAGWQVSLHGHGRCSLTAPEPDATDASLPSINCHAIRWEQQADDMLPVDIAETWVQLSSGEIFQPRPVSEKLRKDLIAAGKATAQSIQIRTLASYDNLAGMPDYLDIRGVLQTVDAVCHDLPRTKAASLALSRCASLQRKLIAFLDQDGSLSGRDWSDVLERVNRDPAFTLEVDQMNTIVNLVLILTQEESALPLMKNYLDRARHRLAMLLDRPGLHFSFDALEAIRADAMAMGRPIVEASVLKSLQAKAVTPDRGVLIHVLGWQWPSEPPRPKAWPSDERWPPKQWPDILNGRQDPPDRWQQILILASEPGEFTIKGIVVAQMTRGKDGKLTELVIDTSHEITAQWKPVLRLIVLITAAIALVLAIWWPPALQRRLCGDA